MRQRLEEFQALQELPDPERLEQEPLRHTIAWLPRDEGEGREAPPRRQYSAPARDSSARSVIKE